jgi:urea transporter
MDLLIYVLAVWFVFYLVNHSLIFKKIRGAAMPALPNWLQTLIQCAICFTFWLTAALSLFAGFSAVIFAAPPCVLFVDLAYRKLGGLTDDNDEQPGQPTILK